MSIPALLIIAFLGFFLLLLFLFWTQWKRLQKTTEGLAERNRALTALRVLDRVVLTSVQDLDKVVQEIVNIVPSELRYPASVIALIDKKAEGLRRTAISRTPEIEEILKEVPTPFHQQIIPWEAKENPLITAVLENKSLVTYRLSDLSYPALPREVGDSIQKKLNIKANVVYPFSGRSGILGVIFFSTTKTEDKIFPHEREIMQGFAQEVGLAIENAILYERLEEKTRELAEANIKLKELDKLKDEFLSVASHELRTPMTNIKSYLWMALNKSSQTLSGDLRKYLDRAFISTDRLIKLVNDMLNVSRIERGKIEIKLAPTDILALARDVIQELTPQAQEKKLALEVTETPNLPQVMADSEKIREVLTNLLSNALKFTEKGKVEVGFKTKDSMIEIAVADTGQGIKKEDLAKLFQKFGRLDNSYTAIAEGKGTGLGLYICKALVELHKGQIWAQSEGAGKGATFIFSLPAVSLAELPIVQKTLNVSKPKTFLRAGRPLLLSGHKI